ncbi:MAG: hypothetical protein V3V16_00310 [Melioribacteraceae bacterium]
MKTKINILTLFIFLFSTQYLSAQTVDIKSGSNWAIQFKDEGSFGSIKLRNGIPNPYTMKIYSFDEKLYFNGALVGSGLEDNDWTINSNNMYSNVTGFVGVKKNNPGFTLDVGGDINFDGALYLNGISGTAGQVLTSNGSGDATWTTTTTTDAVGFFAVLKTNQEFPTGQENKLDGLTETYDDGNNFNNGTGEFKAPVGGLYHFDVKVGYSNTNAVVNSVVTYIAIKVNNSTPKGLKFKKRVSTGPASGEAVMFSTNVKLNINDKVTFHFFSPNVSNLYIDWGNTDRASSVSGFKIN